MTKKPTLRPLSNAEADTAWSHLILAGALQGLVNYHRSVAASIERGPLRPGSMEVADTKPEDADADIVDVLAHPWVQARLPKPVAIRPVVWTDTPAHFVGQQPIKPSKKRSRK